MVLALPAVTACMGEPYSSVAIFMDGSVLQVRLADCPPSSVTVVRIIPLRTTHDNLLDENVPSVWQVSFPKPTVTGVVTVGDEAPPGGTLDVPLAAPLDPATEYVTLFRTGVHEQAYETFKPADLHDGRVRFNDAYVSHDEFERRSACTKK
ncbi:hypothetical protein [Dactylosporangium salmoneum]|uniref:Lipoprotein n=1 Tax=Dactylosporangium salmoneum TaxID=53361 RepID=A0ABN3G5R1_9ACTN